MPRNITLPDRVRDAADPTNSPVLDSWKQRTPAQAAQWVDDNVNNLAEAKAFLKIVARLLVYLLRRAP